MRGPNLFNRHRQPLWFTGFLVLLALIPLPFGAARPWASDTLGVLVGLLLLAMLVAKFYDAEPESLPAPWRRLSISAGLIAAIAIWAYVQTTDWLFCCNALWGEAAQALGRPVRTALSLTPDNFPESILRIFAYVGSFLLAFVGGRDKELAAKLLKTLAGTALVYALYGLIMQSTGLHMVLWYDKWAYQDFVTSTFVNKNSYATYAGIGLQCCLARLWRQFKHRPKPQPNQRANIGVWLERLGRQEIYAVITILILFGALVLTGSRGGIVAGIMGTLAFGTSLAINRRWGWRRWLGILIPAIILIIAVGLFSADVVMERLSADQMQADTQMRAAAYNTTLNAIAQHPYTGYGLGSFNNVFRIYRDASIDQWFEHAHNDYLELALELGIPAALAFGLALLLLISCCLQGVWQRRRQEVYSALAVGVTVSVGLHSLVDFGMQIPAVAVTYAALLGLGVAQSVSTGASREASVPSEDAELIFPDIRRR